MMLPRHLDICRHRVRSIRAPYVLILQHHLVGGASRIVAPIVPRGLEANVLLPDLLVASTPHQALLVNLATLPLATIGEIVGSGLDAADDVFRGLDVILRGDPAWMPH